MQIKENGDTAYWSTIIDHSCHWQLAMRDSGQQVEKHIDNYDLGKYSDYNRESLNINYEFNQNLKIVNWRDKTDLIVNRIEKEGKFKREQ